MPIVEIKPGAIDSIIGRPDKAYVTPGLEDVEQGSDAPSGSQILGAAFRQDNTVGSFLSQKDAFVPKNEQEGFDAWSQVKNTPYELHWDRFADTHNQTAFDMRKAQIDQEEADKRTLATAPWYKSVPAQIAAGAIDWPSLLPGGAIIRSAKGGVSVLRTAATTGALSGISAGVQEGALHATQETRTPEESVNGIGASVILGSLLGAAGGKLLSGAEYRASEEALSRHLMDEAPLTSGDMLAVPREMPSLVSSVKPETEVAGEVSVAPGEEAIIEPHLSVSGEFELRHGLRKDAATNFDKTGTHEFVENYNGERYDGEGDASVFGDAIYLDNTGIWTNDEGRGMGLWDIKKSLRVAYKPENALLLSPDTISTIRRKIGIDKDKILTPEMVRDYAKNNGNDSIIIQGFGNLVQKAKEHYAEKYGVPNEPNNWETDADRIPFDNLDEADKEILLKRAEDNSKGDKEEYNRYIRNLKNNGTNLYALSDAEVHTKGRFADTISQDQVVVYDKKIVKTIGEAPKGEIFAGQNFEAGPSTIAAKQQSGDVITGEANINEGPLTASQMISDIPGVLKSGSIDTMRFSSAPKTEEIDALIEAGKKHEGEAIDRLFGEDADKVKGFLRKNNTDKIDDLIYEKFGSYETPEAKEAMGIIYGMNNHSIINTESLQSLRDRLSNLEFAVHDAASGKKGDIENLAKELAWVAPDLPDISASIASHSETQRIAVLALARTFEDMRANNIDPYPILKQTVAYTEKSVGGDADDARLLLDRLSQYANQYMKADEAVAPDQISGAVELSPVHQDIAEVSNILNEAPQAVKEPQTLLAFLKGLGGIKDYKGELKGADIRKRFPGLINNKKGMELDKAREAAAEAGYLGPDIQTAIEKSTPDDLIQKILSDEPVYSALDKDQAYEYRAQQNAKAFEDKVKSAREELDGIAFGTHPDILDDAARIMAYDDVDPFDALEVAATRTAVDVPEVKEVEDNLGEIFDAWITDNRPALEDNRGVREGSESATGRPEGEGSTRGVEARPQSQNLGTGSVATNDSVQVGTSERIYGAERPGVDRLNQSRSTEEKRGRLTALERKEKISERKKLISQANKLLESNQNVLVGRNANKFEELGRKISELGFDLDRDLDLSKIKSPEQRQSTLAPETISVIHQDYMRSKPIYMAISEAATGVRQNADTAVDEILLGRSKTVTPQDLYDNFAASRDALRAQYGDTIKLYRAEGKQKKKPTKNWATTREFAANFGNNISEVDTPIENIVAATVGPQGNYHEIIVTDPRAYGIDINAKKVAYELGAEGKPQSVIPGAERISDKALAERRAEAPLKGGNEAPGGMFDQANTDQADIFAQTNIDTKPASVSAAAVLPADLEGNSIAGKLASTIANLSRFPTKGGMTQFNPLLRILHSPSAVVREIGLKLFENPIYLKKNMEGIASEPAAETFMKTWNAGLRRSVEFMNKSYADYAKAAGAGPRLTRDQFQEMVGRAMRRGDVSDNQHVEAVAKKWRSDVFNPLKDAAIKAGLLPQDVKVDTATSYFSRMWNRNKLIAQEPKFKRIVKQWIERSMPGWQAEFDRETAETINKMTQQGEMFGKAEKLREYEAARIREREERFGIEPGEVSGHIADEVFNTLTGRTEGTARPELIKIQSRGPLKERTFGIPDYWVEEFLEDNIDRVGERYVRMMSADVEMANKFGHLDIEKIKQDINAHYAQLSERAGNEAQRMALDVSRKNDLTDIEGLWDILRGVGSKFSHPWERNFEHVSRLARHYNYIRSMGEASLASLSESVRPAMVHGLVPYMNTMGQLLTNLKGIKMSIEEAKLAGNIAEQALGHRMATMSEISDPYSSLTPTEAVMKNLTSVASVWNGIRILTDWQKSVAAVMTQDRILKGTANYASLPMSEKAYLAYLGIDANMAQKISAQFKEHGNLTDGVRVAKTANWKDLNAKRVYYAAINKDVDSIITTSGVADVPLFANTPVGAAMLQFRRFALAAHQRVLLRGLQEDQARFLGGMIAMASIGMMTTWLKGISGNREGKQPDLSKKPGWWIAEGLDRSGVLAGGMEVANAIEKASGFNPVKTPLQVFDEGAQRQSQRIQNRTLMGAVMGPTVGLVEDINTVAGIPMTMYRGQRIAQGQKNAAERLLPFSSYPFVRQMLRYTVNTPN